MQEPAEETPHLNPIKGSRSLITEQKRAEWLRVGKGASHCGPSWKCLPSLGHPEGPN